MFTLFHVIVLVGLASGAMLGARVGSVLFGTVGGVIGGIVGAVAGIIVGRVPDLLALRLLTRDLRVKSTAELRAYLRSPDCLTPNCVLLELRSRGEDIQCELPFVLDLLASENVGRRCFGWAALTSAFPDLVDQVRDYRIGDSVDECRRKIETLRRVI